MKTRNLFNSLRGGVIAKKSGSPHRLRDPVVWFNKFRMESEIIKLDNFHLKLLITLFASLVIG